MAVELAGRRLVVFRARDGRPAALDADCSHMGADLRRGQVIEGCIRCPFHGWQYNDRGDCVQIPGQAEIPPAARQSAYEVVQRHGLLFAFVGAEPSYALPNLFESASPLVASAPHRYRMECPWYMFAGNGFDLQHFNLVHDRELEEPPVIDSPAPFARRIRFRWRVLGTTSLNRLIRVLIGPRVEVTITSWAGTLVAVTSQFRRAVSRVLFAIAPSGVDGTEANLIVLTERGALWRRPLQPFNLRVRRAMTLAFLRGDIEDVRRGVYRPGMLIEADQTLIDYYRWLASLFQPAKENTCRD